MGTETSKSTRSTDAYETFAASLKGGAHPAPEPKKSVVCPEG